MIYLDTEIQTEPTAKGRPRAYARGGHVRMYTPSKTVKAEERIRLMLQPYFGKIPEGIPLKMTVTFFRERPKSGKKLLLPITRPDLDNYEKLLCDAITPWIIHDDAQITTKLSMKRYGDPKIALKVEDDEKPS